MYYLKNKSTFKLFCFFTVNNTKSILFLLLLLIYERERMRFDRDINYQNKVNNFAKGACSKIAPPP